MRAVLFCSDFIMLWEAYMNQWRILYTLEADTPDSILANNSKPARTDHQS